MSLQEKFPEKCTKMNLTHCDRCEMRLPPHSTFIIINNVLSALCKNCDEQWAEIQEIEFEKFIRSGKE